MLGDVVPFDALTSFLERTRALWSPRPFCGDPPWVHDEPELVHWLLERSDEELENAEPALDRLRDRLHPGLRALLEEGEASAHLPGLEPLPRRPVAEACYGVPARKWEQVKAFLGHPEPAPFLDWCAGKGHLGRTFAALHQQPGVALEIDAALVAGGTALARRSGVDLTFRTLDVLEPAFDPELARDKSILALHACGNLGDRAVRMAVEARARAFSWAPCCFHRGRDPFVPWSERGTLSSLTLTTDELRLPTTDEIIADRRTRWQRRTAMAFRSGLDHLRGLATGDLTYRSLPSVPDTWLDLGFEGFCRRVAARFDVPLPRQPHWELAERVGVVRTGRARRLGLVRSAFRRPLEVWLDLDRALWLEEQGLRVAVGTFCEKATTPRNVLVTAARS